MTLIPADFSALSDAEVAAMTAADKAEAFIEGERQHARAIRVSVGPHMRAVGEEAIGAAFREWRICEQRGGDRLQRETYAQLLHHVGL